MGLSWSDVANTATLGIPSAVNSLSSGWESTWDNLSGQDAANEAADIAQQNADANIALQREMYDRNMEMSDPFIQGGTNAFARMQGAQRPQLGMNGFRGSAEGQMMDLGNFEASPEYQVMLDEGNRNILAGASAGGMRLSGRTLKELGRFGTGLASREYGNWFNRKNTMLDRERSLYGDYYGRRTGEFTDDWNRQSQVAGMGLNAMGQAMGSGNVAANNIMQQNSQAAEANAAAAMQGYNFQNNLIGQGLQAYGYSQGRG